MGGSRGHEVHVEQQKIKCVTCHATGVHGFEPVVIKDSDDLVGIVTVHDGPALPDGEIIAPVVGAVAR